MNAPIPPTHFAFQPRRRGAQPIAKPATTITTRTTATTTNITSPLLSLPAELLNLITSQLPYPDALSLKHTSPHLYPLIDTSVQLKVSWLVSRHARGLERPKRKCILKTDAAFCASGGGEVRRIMERRRGHWDCDRLKGCEVVEGARCEGRRRGRRRGRQGWEDLRALMFKLGRDRRWEWVGGFLGMGLLGFLLALMVELVQWLLDSPSTV